jgi:hypothetical protein
MKKAAQPIPDAIREGIDNVKSDLSATSTSSAAVKPIAAEQTPADKPEAEKPKPKTGSKFTPTPLGGRKSHRAQGPAAAAIKTALDNVGKLVSGRPGAKSGDNSAKGGGGGTNHSTD